MRKALCIALVLLAIAPIALLLPLPHVSPRSRNMVNLAERGLATNWSVEGGKFRNVKWAITGGYHAFGTPVVSGGKVFVAAIQQLPQTNVPNFRRAMMMALREGDGKILWTIPHDYPHGSQRRLTYAGGLPSTGTVSGQNLYYITAALEVICADCEDGKIRWRYDMVKELKVSPFGGDGWGEPLRGSPLIVGDLVFVVTGNGRDDDDKLPSPEAPSFIALRRNTGKLVWQSNLPGNDLIEGQWSSPTFAIANRHPQVIFGGGDGVIYSFELRTGELLWKCDLAPDRASKLAAGKLENHVIGNPVVVGDRLYVGLGVKAESARPSPWSYFVCLDITKQGDVSLKSYDPNDPANKESALIWAYGGPIQPLPAKGRRVDFGATLCTPAVHDGLVYIAELNGYMHCLDANNGQPYWTDDLKAGIWASPYWADGKVYLGTEDGTVRIYVHGKKLTRLPDMETESGCYTSPSAANGVLFVPTRQALYAIK